MKESTAEYLKELKARLLELDGSAKPLTPEFEQSLRHYEAQARADVEKQIAYIEADDGAAWEREGDEHAARIKDGIDAYMTDLAQHKDGR